MQRVLLEIPVQAKYLGIPLFGTGWVAGLVILATALSAWYFSRKQGWNAVLESHWIAGVILAAVIVAPNYLEKVPIYGFGMALVFAYFIGVWTAALRGKELGITRDLIQDMALVIFFSGIVGARIWYVIQKWDQFAFNEEGDPRSFPALVQQIFSLPSGGLVLFGGVISGAIAFAIFSRYRGISPLLLADIAAPGIMSGLMCGRIGCFLNGCCWGDPCQLPWSVRFPEGSPPFELDKILGFIPADATLSQPLHPAQIYSSINALVLSLLLFSYFPYRKRNGDVLMLAWIGYPIVRICEEILRADETGQFGTTLTISQLTSIGMLIAAIPLGFVLRRKPILTKVDVEPNQSA